MNDNGIQVNHAAPASKVTKAALLDLSDNVFRRASALAACTVREIVAEQDALKTALGRLEAASLRRPDVYAADQKAKAMGRGREVLEKSAERMAAAVASGEYTKAAKRV